VVGTTVFVVLCSIDAVAVQCMAFRYDSCYGSSRVGSGAIPCSNSSNSSIDSYIIALFLFGSLWILRLIRFVNQRKESGIIKIDLHFDSFDSASW